jgi:hypothetical protein
MKVYEKWGYSATASRPTCFTYEEKSPILFAYETWRAPKLVWKLCRRERAFAGNVTPTVQPEARLYASCVIPVNSHINPRADTTNQR